MSNGDRLAAKRLDDDSLAKAVCHEVGHLTVGMALRLRPEFVLVHDGDEIGSGECRFAVRPVPTPETRLTVNVAGAMAERMLWYWRRAFRFPRRPLSPFTGPKGALTWRYPDDPLRLDAEQVFESASKALCHRTGQYNWKALLDRTDGFNPCDAEIRRAARRAERDAASILQTNWSWSQQVGMALCRRLDMWLSYRQVLRSAGRPARPAGLHGWFDWSQVPELRF